MTRNASDRQGPPLHSEPGPEIPRYRGGAGPDRPAVAQQSAFTSFGIHLVLLLIAWVGLPDFMRSEIQEPSIMTVDILPISDISNAPINKTKPLAKNQTPPPPTKKPVTPPKSNDAAPPPAPPKEDKAENVVKEKPTPEKKEDVKTSDAKNPAPPKEEKKDKSEKDSLDSILKDIAQQAQETDEKSDKKATEPAGARTISDRFDPNAKMSISQMDAIKQQLIKCWNPPAGVKDDYTLIVVLKARYNQDGTLAGRPEFIKGVNNPAAIAAAMRALEKPACAKLNNVPADKYAAWKEIEVTFDPKNALY